MGVTRPHGRILDPVATTPFAKGLGIKVVASAQRRDRIWRSLYLCSDSVRGHGAFVKNLGNAIKRCIEAIDSIRAQ